LQKDFSFAAILPARVTTNRFCREIRLNGKFEGRFFQL
jgi:hypothetical protein